jgi:uncharacterized lipoprotein YehR (DUF1307 family)
VSKSFMFKVVLVAIIAMGIIVAVCACGGGGGLVGKWSNAAEKETLDLTADGNAVMDGISGTYKAEGDKLTLTIEGSEVVFDYALDGDSLKLTYGSESMTYDRVK